MANLAKTKWCKKTKKWLKPWEMGTHLSVQRELSNEYQHDRVKMVFKKNLCSCALDESSLGIRRVNKWKCKNCQVKIKIDREEMKWTFEGHLLYNSFQRRNCYTAYEKCKTLPHLMHIYLVSCLFKCCLGSLFSSVPCFFPSLELFIGVERERECIDLTGPLAN